MFDDIIWLPAHESAINKDDTLYFNLTRMIFLMTQATDTPCHLGGAYTVCWGRILQQLHQNTRILLVIHGSDFRSEASSLSLDYFLNDLLRVASVKVVLVGFSNFDEGLASIGQSLYIDPLDFESTILLFARLNQCANFSARDIIASTKALRDNAASGRRKKIYERIGAGIPSAIRKAAFDISDEELADMMRLANRKAIEIHSRAQLEEEIEIKVSEEARELTKKNFLSARDIRETIDELEGFRQSFPSLEELHEREKSLSRELDEAVASKKYDEASKMQDRLKKLQGDLSKEIKWKETTTLRRLPSF
jgi:hypothetical protein